MKHVQLFLLLILCSYSYSQKDSTRVKGLLDIAYAFEKTSLDGAKHINKNTSILDEKIKYLDGETLPLTRLKDIHLLEGNYDKSTDYYLLSNTQYEKLKNSFRLEQQNQLKNKNSEILQQQLQNEKNEALLQNQINKNELYAFGIVTLLFMSFVLWYRHRQKQKLNKQVIQALKKQQELKSLEALIKGEDIERSRIAKDLHDGVNGNLSAIKYNLSSITKHKLNSDEHETFDAALEMLDIACQQIRNITHDLAPPSLQNFGLTEALDQYCNRINSSSTINVTFQHFGHRITLPKKTETTIYHILQELISNSVKHAQANSALLQIHENKKVLHITVEDDGNGYDTRAVTHGLGLNNIKSRVDFLNAEMDVKSDTKGTSVTIDIDLNKILHYD